MKSFKKLIVPTTKKKKKQKQKQKTIKKKTIIKMEQSIRECYEGGD